MALELKMRSKTLFVVSGGSCIALILHFVGVIVLPQIFISIVALVFLPASIFLYFKLRKEEKLK
jgi:hypothetical protein